MCTEKYIHKQIHVSKGMGDLLLNENLRHTIDDKKHVYCIGSWNSDF